MKIIISLLVSSLSMCTWAADPAEAANLVNPLLIGSPVPQTAVTSIDGAAITLPDAIKQPTVLVFFRGHW